MIPNIYNIFISIHNRDIHEIKEKLGIFLNSVKNSYNEWIETKPFDKEREYSFDSLFGECTNILLNLLDFIIKYVYWLLNKLYDNLSY